MKYWLVVKELAWAAGLFLSAAIFLLAGKHMWHRAGVSAAFAVSIMLSIAYAAPLFVFGWERLANLLSLCGYPKQAELLLVESLCRWGKLVGQNGPGVAAKKGNLADFYGRQGRISEAERLYQEVLECWSRSWLGLASPLCAHLDRYAALLGRTAKKEKQHDLRRLIRGWPIAQALTFVLSALLVVGAASYLVCVQLLMHVISTFPAGPPELVHDYVDDLAGIEKAVLGARGATDVYLRYAERHSQLRADEGPAADKRHEEEAYWGLNKAVASARQISQVNPGALAQAAVRLADIELSRGNLDKALRLYQEALSGIQEGQVRAWGRSASGASDKVDALLGLGTISLARQDYAEAGRYFDKAGQTARAELGGDSLRQVEALMGLAEARLKLGALSQAEGLLDEAIDRQEKSFQESLRLHRPTEDKVGRLVAALVKKAAVLRLTGRDKEAEAVDKHIDEIQMQRRPQIRLDDQAQARIVETVKDTTGRLLSLKYQTKDARQARRQLSDTLTTAALHSVGRMPWYHHGGKTGPDEVPRIDAPDTVNLQFDQISVRSPDDAGLLMVEAWGRCELVAGRQSVRDEQFAFAYRIKPPRNVPARILVEDVVELGSVGGSE
ncbi:MAG TPA: tetratricopeptide repeat protein [Candidatus Obscuribacterales bacterium]